MALSVSLAVAVVCNGGFVSAARRGGVGVHVGRWCRYDGVQIDDRKELGNASRQKINFTRKGHRYTIAAAALRDRFAADLAIDNVAFKDLPRPDQGTSRQSCVPCAINIRRRQADVGKIMASSKKKVGSFRGVRGARGRLLRARGCTGRLEPGFAVCAPCRGPRSARGSSSSRTRRTCTGSK